MSPTFITEATRLIDRVTRLIGAFLTSQKIGTSYTSPIGATLVPLLIATARSLRPSSLNSRSSPGSSRPCRR